MEVQSLGSPSFKMLKVNLSPGEEIIVEPGAMASQDVGVVPSTKMNGGFLGALIMKFFGSESFFINFFRNLARVNQTVYLTQSTPGDILERTINNEEIYLESGSFIARTSGVRAEVRWAGISCFLAGEGLFKLCFSGQGRLWYGSYGAVVEKEIVGDYVVDSGHLLSWPPSIEMRIGLSGSLFSSIFSKEGLVLKLRGHGKIQLQTRSVKGLAQWLNVRFWS